MNSTTTSEPEIKPIVQDGKLRFPEGHVQLQLIKTKAAEEAKTFAMDLPARLVWDEERTQRVYAPFAGRVLQIKADLGSLVSKGSPLLLLSSPEFGAAQSDLAKSLADVSVAEKAFSRQRELFEAGVTPKKDLEQAKADYERANAENERALSKIRLYGGGQLVNQQLVLSSDLNGVVVERNVNPGQEIRPEQFGPGSPALFVVTDPSRLWVQIDAKETDLGTLKPGAIFELSI
ncbi:MAG: efflux RND transporter periplasmic adaptor subunit, partial [Betaproteobacteria bacterium]